MGGHKNGVMKCAGIHKTPFLSNSCSVGMMWCPVRKILVLSLWEPQLPSVELLRQWFATMIVGFWTVVCMCSCLRVWHTAILMISGCSRSKISPKYCIISWLLEMQPTSIPRMRLKIGFHSCVGAVPNVYFRSLCASLKIKLFLVFLWNWLCSIKDICAWTDIQQFLLN